MKEIWVLTIKTSLPETCVSYNDLKMTIMAFDTYEKARAAFREKLRTFAFSKNTMFNGKGQITALNDEASDSLSETEITVPETEESRCLAKERLMKLQGSLAEAFAGNDTKIDLPVGYYTDACYLSMQVKSDSVRLYADLEAADMGYQSLVCTNIFSMAQEQNYYLYINDMFDQEDSSELYMDLVKVSID